MGNEASQSTQAYGGRIDNDINIKWKNVKCSDSFYRRDGHCSCSVSVSGVERDSDCKSGPTENGDTTSHNLLYVFGGVLKNDTGDCDNIETNDLLLYNADLETWTKVQTKGAVPCSRAGASICSVGKHLYLFGGLSHTKGFLNKVYKYDTETSIWELIPTCTGPSARDKQGIAAIGTKIYLFGGFGPKPRSSTDSESEDEEDADMPSQGAVKFGWYDGIFIFDTTSNTWSNPMQMNLSGPTPRAAMGMCALHKYLIIFGGKTADGRVNDLHLYNTESRRWETNLSISGQQPEPRSFHTLTTVGNRVVLFGGRGVQNQHFNKVHVFDTETRQWLQPHMEGDIPAARGVHTATVVGRRFIIYGGSSKFDAETMQCLDYYGDLHIVDTADILSGGVVTQESSTEVTDDTNVPPQGDGDAEISTKMAAQNDGELPAKITKTV